MLDSNRIKTYLGGSRTVLVALAVIFASAGIAQAATTIGTYITTGGALTVSGLSTFLGGATTTQLTLLAGDTITNPTASSTVISGALTTTGGISPTTGAFSSLATFSGSAKVGASGSTVAQSNFGNCVIWASATTIAASSTKQVDCGSGYNGSTAIGAITPTGTAFVSATSSWPTTVFGGLVIESAQASSTTGYLTLTISNLTGAAYTWTAAASSSINYWIVK